MPESILNPEKITVAAFDFDGTITTIDTLPGFIWFSIKFKRLLFSTLKVIPILWSYRFRRMSNHEAKEKLFSEYFGDTPFTDFTKACAGFVPGIQKLARPAAMDRIRWHQRMGHVVVIVSASVEDWIIPWANHNGIHTVLATQIQVVDGRLTGRFFSKNCHGQEKVNRLLTYLAGRSNYELYAYGDSRGDKELLALADHPFYRCFD